MTKQQTIKCYKFKDGKKQFQWFSESDLKVMGKNEDDTYGGNGSEGWIIEGEAEEPQLKRLSQEPKVDEEVQKTFDSSKKSGGLLIEESDTTVKPTDGDSAKIAEDFANELKDSSKTIGEEPIKGKVTRKGQAGKPVESKTEKKSDKEELEDSEPKVDEEEDKEVPESEEKNENL